MSKVVLDPYSAGSGSNVQDGFVRQRRNLLLICALLFVIEVSGVRITDINILGNRAQIDNPQMFHWLLWGLLIYFFIRFYQYSHDLSDLGMRYAYNSILNELIVDFAFRKAIASYDFKSENPDIKAKPEYRLNSHEIYSNGPLEWRFKLYAQVVAQDKDASVATNPEFEVIVYDRELLRQKMFAGIKAGFKTRYFLEFYMPYLLAIGLALNKANTLCVDLCF